MVCTVAARRLDECGLLFQGEIWGCAASSGTLCERHHWSSSTLWGCVLEHDGVEDR
jgi:hypothetical protein